jgi:hypothetical protein
MFKPGMLHTRRRGRSMNKTLSLLPMLAGLLLATHGTARAQDAGACPQLPVDAGLTWEHRASGDADFCRALRSDGSEAFGLYISPKPNFEPVRADREERGQIDGQQVYWYRAEIAAKPGVEARETLLQLRDGRAAHVWLQADSAAQLNSAFQLAQGLHFGPGGDKQLASGQ